jgi:pimeloyl-ACP methyl ester carboxylesterase
VVVLDLPGFGRSPRPEPSHKCLNLEELACDVLAAGSGVGTGPLFLAGHSHGGGVAQFTAGKYPEKVRGIVPIATLGTPAHPTYRLLSLPGMNRLMKILGRCIQWPNTDTLARAIVRAVSRDIFAPEKMTAGQLEKELSTIKRRPEILRTMVDVTLSAPSTQLAQIAPNIRCPVVFVHGEDDDLVPIRHAYNMHRIILEAGGQSEFVGVSNAGHMLLHYQADLVVETIKGLIARTQ